MSIYENNECPVCGKEFADGDDVVTCPECGTPHHRECYNSLGRCANKKLHGTDFVYKRNEKTAEEKNAPVAPEAAFNIANDGEHEPKVCKACGAEIPQGSFTCPECGNHQIDIEFNTDKLKKLYTTNRTEVNPELEKSTEKLDDISMADAAAVVSVNTVKFLPKFKRNRKLNWNWSAFFFGPLYLIFRKMYMPGALIMMLEFASRLIVSAVFAEQLTPIMNALSSVYSSSNSMSTNEFREAILEIAAMPEYQTYMLAASIIVGIMLIINIITALLFDNFYRKRVIKTVKDVDEKINMGESFSLTGPIPGMENKISQAEMRRMFLSRQGGVSIFAPLIAVMAIQIITNLLSMLV